MSEEQYDAHVRAWHEHNAKFRTEDEILADPATEDAIRLRVVADICGRALFKGLRRHYTPIELPIEGRDDKLPPPWDQMNSWDRGHVWRPAIYDMLRVMSERGLLARKDI